MRIPARQSMAFFVIPDDDVVVSPLDGSQKYPPIVAKEYMKNKLENTY